MKNPELLYPFACAGLVLSILAWKRGLWYTAMITISCIGLFLFLVGTVMQLSKRGKNDAE